MSADLLGYSKQDLGKQKHKRRPHKLERETDMSFKCAQVPEIKKHNKTWLKYNHEIYLRLALGTGQKQDQLTPVMCYPLIITITRVVKGWDKSSQIVSLGELTGHCRISLGHPLGHCHLGQADILRRAPLQQTTMEEGCSDSGKFEKLLGKKMDFPLYYVMYCLTGNQVSTWIRILA